MTKPIFISFFLCLYLNCLSQDTLKGEYYIGLNSTYFEYYKVKIRGPEGNIFPVNFNDSVSNLKGEGLFLVKKIPKKLSKMKSKYFAPLQVSFNDSIESFMLKNEDLFFSFKIKKRRKVKKVSFFPVFNDRSFITGLTFYKANITFIIKYSKQINLLTEKQVTKKMYQIINIIFIE